MSQPDAHVSNPATPFVPSIQLGLAHAWQPIADGTTEWWRTTRQFGHTPPHDGTLRLTPQTAGAGRRVEVTLTYTAGRRGIGAWGHFAVECPLVRVTPANVRVTCSDPRVVPHATISGGIVDVLLKAAPLREGESLVITFGDDSRFFVPPTAPAAAGRYPFWAAVDAGNTGVYRQVPNPPALAVHGNSATHLRVTVPSTIQPGVPFDLHVVAADRQNDNPDPGYRGRLTLACPGGELTGPLSIDVDRDAQGVVRLAGLRLTTPGVHFISAVDEASGLAGRSNPIHVLPAAARLAGLDEQSGQSNYVAEGGFNVYWGDLHAHNEHCDGKLTIGEFYRWGRDVRRLDFVALTNHVEGAKRYLVEDFWPRVVEYAREWSWPGTFVSFLAYEWGSWDLHGDKCVYFLDDDQPYFPANDERSGRPDGLWAALAAGGHRAITIPHHSKYGGPTDWSYRDDRWQPVVEICQMRGSMERGGPRSVQHALSRGFRLGFIGSSDNHNGQPGNGALAAVLAPELTREALFAALQARRCYATTGARMLVDFRVNGHLMGEEIAVPAASAARTITARVTGTAEIERVAVVKDNEDAYVVEPDALTATLTWTDDSPLEQTSYYYLRVEQRDGEMAWASPVWVSSGDTASA